MKHAIAIFSVLLLSMFELVQAQNSVNNNSWFVYPTYTNPPQKVIDTENIVYFTSGGNLFSYDKKNDENYSFTTQNKLNDTNIIGIYYNHQRRYLVVCYESGNIDLIYDDGSVKNLSDISDSSLPKPITITNLCFDNDRIYVSTNFGLVCFNEPRAEVVSSGNYGKVVNAVSVVGKNLIVHFDGAFHSIDKNKSLSSVDSFVKMYNNETPLQTWAFGSDAMFVLTENKNSMLSLHNIDENGTSLKSRDNFSSRHTLTPKYTSDSKSGDVYYVADGNLYRIDTDEAIDGKQSVKETMVASLPEEFAAGVVGTCKGASSVWSLTTDGLANFDVEAADAVTMLKDRFKPDGFPVILVRYFYPSNDNRRLYAQNSGVTSYRFGGSTRGLQYSQTAGCIDLESGDYEDVTAYPVVATAPEIVNRQRSLGLYAIAPSSIAEDPADPNVRFVATSDDGIYKVRGTTVEGRFGHTNSPVLLNDNRDIFYGCAFDNFGNLWTMMNSKSYTNSPIAILPADKVKLPVEQISESDWIHPDLSGIGYWGGQDARFLFCKKSSLVVIVCAGGNLMFVYDHRGTGKDFSDDRFILWEKMYDQDGKLFDPNFKTSLCEDLNGKIWIGTNEGVMELNPSVLFNTNSTFTHLKVPRNDGTNLADYLMENEFINDISVDAANRKWIATAFSGVYCVSPTGDEIIHSFNTENSPLPVDFVNCVYADKTNGKIYIGTDRGLLSYSNDATAPKDNYDELLIFPNPVKPEFRGHVTISGLMDKSLVKIADASGHVICQGRSEGGQFSWNVCNSAGVKVPTGVYYVFVSQNSAGSSAAVGKIMVVN